MRYRIKWVLALYLATAMTGSAWASWDGDPSLDDIDFNLESFIDINAYQFRRSEEVKWYDVENGLRIAAGSLETNYLYLLTDIRLKAEITPHVKARLWLADVEWYEPREFPRPLLELELQPTSWPVSLSLLGVPAYAKREADLGLAMTLGQRPWNFFRVAWLNEDYYFNEKNELDGSYYQEEPSQLTLEGAYQWADRYKLRVLWQENNPLEYVLDDQVSVFAYENQNFQMTFDIRVDEIHNIGVALRTFETTQSLDDTVSPRSQDIRYFSIDGYWFRPLRQRDEWTLGLRYDDFVNEERTPADFSTSFDYTYWTAQIYTTYYHPFSAHQAWEVGLYVGQAKIKQDFLAATVADEEEDGIEAKLQLGWQLFSTDQNNALTFAFALNLDEIASDPFDGGSVRLRSQF
jgi:hypothetical protein